jgi:predicted 2-oxoglutarate/Fe(II)-dependent dioxygenase YbiX
MVEYRQEANGIFSFPLFHQRFCRSTLKHLTSSGNWADAEVRLISNDGQYQSAQNRHVRSASWWNGADEDWLYRKFDRKINQILKPFVNQMWQLNLTEHMGSQIVRYRPGDHYIAHKDSGLDLDHRHFTVIAYLNDGFEGGNTYFPHLDYSTKPETGKLILFPSYYVHRAEPVLRGEKYVFISWLVGPFPIKWI